MNTPKPPDEPPPRGTPADPDQGGDAPHGIPAGMEDHESKGRPSSDRDKTETAPNRIAGS